jgi:hypothetical protein
VLFYLCNAASTGPGEDRKNLPLGYCKRKLTTIMAGVNCHRQQTVSAAIKELKEAGVIKQWLKKGASPLYFVDLDWLKEHQYTDAELAEFDYEALKVSRKAYNHEPADFRLGDEDGQRKPYNLDNGNRLTSKTETVVQDNGKRLTPSGLVPPCKAGDLFHLADARVFPTATRDNASQSASLDTFGETRENPGPQTPKAKAPVASPFSPCLPAAPQAIGVPPAPQFVEVPSTMDEHTRSEEDPVGYEECGVCGQKAAFVRRKGLPCIKPQAKTASAFQIDED